MNKWCMIVDVARCVNCQNCTMATKDEYVGNATKQGRQATD